jgi:hypothetical protein
LAFSVSGSLGGGNFGDRDRVRGTGYGNTNVHGAHTPPLFLERQGFIFPALVLQMRGCSDFRDEGGGGGGGGGGAGIMYRGNIFLGFGVRKGQLSRLLARG